MILQHPMHGNKLQIVVLTYYYCMNPRDESTEVWLSFCVCILCEIFPRKCSTGNRVPYKL